jgi:hypothetical protein
VPENDCIHIEGARCNVGPSCAACPSPANGQRLIGRSAPVGYEERVVDKAANQDLKEEAGIGGMKFDGGKLRAGIAERTIPHLMQMIDRVLDYGAQKYDEGSWQTVPDAARRYHDATNRHRIKVYLAKMQGEGPGNFFDEETGLPHRVGVIINEIFQLGLEVAEYDKNNFTSVEEMYQHHEPVRAAAIKKAQAIKAAK